MLVKFLKTFGTYAEGKSYEIDDEATCKSFIENGFATEVKSETVVDDIKAAFTEMKDSLKEEILSEVKTAVKSPIRLPAQVAEPKSLGEFVQCCYHKKNDILEKKYGSRWINSSGTKGSTMVEGTGNLGGYLVPTILEKQILSVDPGEAVIGSRAFNLPMGSNRVEIPALDQSVTPSGGSSAYFGGINVSYKSENTTYDKVNFTPRKIALQANKLCAYAQFSAEVFQDSVISIDAYLKTLFSSAITQFDEYMYLRGSGSSQPLSIVGNGATVSVARKTANRFQLEDAAKLYAKLPDSCKSKAIWVINSLAFSELVQLEGTNGKVSWIPGGDASAPFRLALFGLPVFSSEHLPALGTAKDVILVDPTKYVIGTRQEMVMAVSEHVGFTEGLITIRIDKRGDAQPMLQSPIKLSGSPSDTVSPFVYLTDAA